MNRLGWDGSNYVSNITFLLGIIYNDVEDAIVKRLNSVKWGGGVSFSYIDNSTIFPGFAIIGVPLYVSSFILLFSHFKVINNSLIELLKRYSYDIYLCQGASFCILNYFHLNDWVFLTLSFILSFVISVISQKLRLIIFK